MKGFISITSSYVKIKEVFSGNIYKIQVQEKLGFHLCTLSHRLSPPSPSMSRSGSKSAEDQIKIASCGTFAHEKHCCGLGSLAPRKEKEKKERPS